MTSTAKSSQVYIPITIATAFQKAIQDKTARCLKRAKTRPDKDGKGERPYARFTYRLQFAGADGQQYEAHFHAAVPEGYEEWIYKANPKLGEHTFNIKHLNGGVETEQHALWNRLKPSTKSSIEELVIHCAQIEDQIFNQKEQNYQRKVGSGTRDKFAELGKQILLDNGINLENKITKAVLQTIPDLNYVGRSRIASYIKSPENQSKPVAATKALYGGFGDLYDVYGDNGYYGSIDGYNDISSGPSLNSGSYSPRYDLKTHGQQSRVYNYLGSDNADNWILSASIVMYACLLLLLLGLICCVCITMSGYFMNQIMKTRRRMSRKSQEESVSQVYSI